MQTVTVVVLEYYYISLCCAQNPLSHLVNQLKVIFIFLGQACTSAVTQNVDIDP